MLLAPKDSPVVIGISCPTMMEDSSLSIVKIEGVDKTFESVSFLKTLRISAKLSWPLVYFPTPAAKPSSVNKDPAAVGIEVEPEVVLYTSPPTMAVKSGEGLPNLWEAMGRAVPSPEYKNCTPNSLDKVSEISTMIASTNTWALFISNCEIKSSIAIMTSGSAEMINEFVSWWAVILVFIWLDWLELNIFADIEDKTSWSAMASAYLR